LLSFKINKDVDGGFVDDTYFKKVVESLLYLIIIRLNIVFSVNIH